MAKQNLHEVKGEFKIYDATERLELIADKLNLISSIDWKQANSNIGLQHAHYVFLTEIRDEISNIVTSLRDHQGGCNE